MTGYVWLVEHTALETTAAHDAGEIVDTTYADSYADAVTEAEQPREGCVGRIVLERDHHENGRTWAYVTDGRLDDWCRDSRGVAVVKTPVRYLREVGQ